MGDKINSSCCRIRQFWERFVDADPHSYQRGEWFDLFLAEVLCQLSDGNSPTLDILSFGASISSVVKRISNEVILELHGVSSKQLARSDDYSDVISSSSTTKPVVREMGLVYDGERNEDAVRHYMLVGRGWRCLALLHTLIPLMQQVNEITGWGEELAAVLVSVYSLMENYQAEEDRGVQLTDKNPYIGRRPPVDIEMICKKSMAKFKTRLSASHSSGPEGGSPPGDHNSSPNRKISSCSLQKRSQKQTELENLRRSSESEDATNNIGQTKSSTIKIRFNPMDFDYFTNVIRSEGDLLSCRNETCPPPLFYKPHSSGSIKKKLNPCDMRDEKILNVLKQTISLHEFKLLAIEVLQDLCHTVFGAKDNCVSVRLIGFSLDNLRSLQFGSAIDNCSKSGAEMKAAFTKLFLFSLSAALKDFKLLKETLQKSALTVMLNLAEDAVSKYPVADDQGALRDFIFAIMFAVISTVHSLSFQLAEPGVLPYLKQFIDSFKGRWAVTAILHILEDRTKSVIFQLSYLISNLKTVRAKMVHTRSCKKGRHKNCEDASALWHHDDVFGGIFSPGSANSLLQEEADYCAVSSVFMILTRLLTEEARPEIAVRTLQAMEECGTCCCFPATPLVTRLVKLMQKSYKNDFRIQKSALMTLEKTLYREMGAVRGTQEGSQLCSVCQGNDNMLKWSCLEAFKHLLLSPDPELSNAIASHLLYVIPHSSIEFQKQMLFAVFFPAFIAFKKRFEAQKKEKDRRGLTTCLSVFAYLLGKVRFAEEFAGQKGASEQVAELFKYPELSKLCTNVIQVFIVVRVWILERKNRSIVLDDSIGELHVFFNQIEESKKHFLSTIKRLQGSLKENGINSHIVFKKMGEWDNYIRRLEELNLYWMSLTELCLNCPQIREYCTRHLSIECYTLLVYFLQHIAKNMRIEAEGVCNIEEKLSYSNELKLKIFEALMILSIISPYSGNPGGVFDLKTKLEKIVESKLGLRAICDVLLRCSGANPSAKINFPSHPMPSLIHLDLNRLNNMDESNSDSAVSGSADEGYDADIEIQSIKHEKKDSCYSGSLPPSRKISYTIDGERRSFKIVHPSLCQIVLHLIVYCYKLDLSMKDCTYSLHKFGSLLRDKEENCLCLTNKGFTLKLLMEFSTILSQERSELVQRELQYAVLEIFTHLARYNLHHQELAIFIQYFTFDNPPVEALLGCLIRLLKCSVQQPKATIRFPCSYSNSNLANGSSPAHKLAITLHNHNLSLGFRNSWTQSGFFFPLSAELGWAMWVQGFSFALWLNIEPPPLPESQSVDQNSSAHNKSTEDGAMPSFDNKFTVDNLLHILSIGYETLVLEFWADTIRGFLHVRLIRSDGGKLSLLSQASVAQGMLTSDRWHHLSLSVHDSIHSGKVIIQVTVIIDGSHEVQVPLAFKGLLVRKARATCVLLGDTAQGDGNGSWKTGGLIMWRRPVLDMAAACWLTSLGPSDTYYTLVQPTVFPLVKQLQDSLLLTYCVQSPGTMNVYPNVISPGGGLHIVSDSDKKNMKLRESSAVSLPFTVDIVALCKPVTRQNCTITSALDSLGGIPIFLFLLARVVELRSGENELDEKCRAEALEVYLRLINCEPHLKSEAQYRCYTQLVSWVLRAGPHPGQHTLNAILEACWIGENKEERQLKDAGTLVSLVFAAGSANSWLLNESRPLLSLLKCLLELLRDDHPHREHNATLLNRANLLDALLNFCKESVLDDMEVFEDKELCSCLIEVMRGLMTAPPRLDHMTSIANYLLLSHPDYATYISHSRTSLYFVLPPPLAPKTKTKSKHMKLGIFGKAESRTDKEYQYLFTQPVDPKKLNKALTNLQIKERSIQEQSNNFNLVKPGQVCDDSYYDGYDADQNEEACDSGIACGSFRNNPATSESIVQQVDCDDTMSGISANTYFISEPSIAQDQDSDEAENSTITSEEDVDDNNVPNFMPEMRNETLDGEGVNESFGGGYETFRSGLFELLKDQLLMTPDSTLPSLLHLSVLTPECFVVMANHHNTNITTAAIKVLEGYWERADCAERKRFCKERGFYLLAIQLNSQQKLRGSSQLADTLAGFITGCHRQPMAHQLGTSFSSRSPNKSYNLAALPPLLALLPRTVSNVPLAHNIATFLHELIKLEEWRDILDYGLVESVLKSIVALMHHSSVLPEHKLLIYMDLHNLLSTITSIILLSQRSNTVQLLSDVLLNIEYVFRVETESCGILSYCSLRLRRTKALILESCLTTMLATISSSSHSFKSSFLSSVLSNSSEDMDSASSSTNSLTNQATKLTKSDLNEKFKFVLTEAVHFATYTEPLPDDAVQGVESDFEGEFVRDVWKKVLMFLVSIIERKSRATRTPWSNVVWVIRDTIRSLSSQLFLWLMSPGHSKELRLFTVQSVLNEPRSKDILIYILSSSQGGNDRGEEVCALFIRDLLERGELNENERKTCIDFCSRFEEWCIPSVLNILNMGASSKADYTEQLKTVCSDATKTREDWSNQLCAKIYKCVYKREGLAGEMLEYSKRVTRDVVARQSRLWKLQIESLKASNIIKAHTLSKWRQIIKHLTHQRAIWHFPQSYPMSWQLDPTEGPSRVRNRLHRCHLNMDPAFLKPDRAEKLTKTKEPLSYLFKGAVSMTDVLVDRLHSNTRIKHMCPATVIVPARELPGELLIGETALYFVPAFNNTSSIPVNDVDEFISEEWPFDCIKELHRRRYELQERALEIFLLNGRTYLLAFQSTKDRDGVMSALMDCELCSRVASEPLCDAVDLWREGHLTNWQYLITLNTLAGRSYNDLMQYPVFPFVLADYTSQTLDLNSPTSYRNFKKPMAIQDKKNEQHYINSYNDRKSEMGDSENLRPQEEPYHYSSHYSNSGTVLHFLLRLPPFTSMFLSYQDNKFDWADRTFHSLHTTWRLTSSESITDVKELIPEFFFLPEFLTNWEGFNFGLKQNGEPVDNVVLPPWAKDPRTFILVHRQALESDYVREEIPHWIDLVFGYKQMGKAAVDSMNVFHPSTYYGFNVESIADPLVRNARQTMVRTYGQTPKQLFRSPHPMVIQSLQPKHHQPQVIPGVKGLNWGSYVGSPSEGAPTIVWQHNHQVVVASLVPLLTNDVFGLAPSTTLLLSYTKESPVSLVNSGTCVLGAALVSWGHRDEIVRAKLRKDQAPFAIVAPSPATANHSIALCASAPDSNQLWIAYTSGKLLVYTYKFDGAGGCLELGKDPVQLVGHKASISAVALSKNFSIAVTCDTDGVAIIWDMNTLAYVRSLPDISNTPITLASISDTLGDIATVGDGKSMRVHTINGDLVGSVVVEPPLLKITAVCFSTAPEGSSVNVIATGMSDFTIQLWSTWDLSPVGKITMSGVSKPIISLTYSQDSRQLYASTSDGVVVIWESGGATTPTVVPTLITNATAPSQHSSSSKQYKFLNLTSLL